MTSENIMECRRMTNISFDVTARKMKDLLKQIENKHDLQVLLLLDKVSTNLSTTETESNVWKSETVQKLKDFVLSLCELGIVPDLGCERELSAEDFAQHVSDVIIVLQCLVILMAQLCEDTQFQKEVKTFQPALIEVLALCVCHFEEFEWSNKQAKRFSENIIQDICRLYGVKTEQDLLTGHFTSGDRLATHGLAKPFFLSVLPKLTSKNWLKSPALKYAFKWCLLNVKHPHLSEILNEVLPPSLLFVDDYRTENKILGLTCLSHIIDNVSPTELKWQGRAEVIYSAIEHLIYTREEEIILRLHPCLLKILGVVEENPTKIIKYNRYDKVFEKILLDMSVEQQLVLRRAYPVCLPQYIDAMGFTVTKHLKQLLEVVYSFLEVYDGPEETSRYLVLKVLKASILTAWPRVHYHSESLIKHLLRFLYDMEADDTSTSLSVKDDLKNLAVDCLRLIKMISPERFQELSKPLLMEKLEMPGIHILKSILDTPECPCEFPLRLS